MVYVRIIGDNTGEDLYVTNSAAGEINTAEATMFEYAGNVMITASNADGITVVKNAEENDNAVYNLMGIKVNETSKGIFIKNGKKYILK